MSESLTGEPAVQNPASNEPTEELQQPTQADVNNQETISTEQSQEAVSDDTAQPKPQTTSSEATDNDDGLAKFAKSQGIDDLNGLSDREKKLLKIASDNQKAYRNQNNTAKVSDAVKALDQPNPAASDDEKFRQEFNQFRYEQKANQFWSEDGRDKSLEPTMVEVLNEKKEQFGAEYARALSKDLDTLYGFAQLKAGKATSTPVDEQAIRQEERDSINRNLSGKTTPAHAVSQASTTPAIDSDWVSNVYDPSNPEHVRMLQEAMAAQRQY